MSITEEVMIQLRDVQRFVVPAHGRSRNLARRIGNRGVPRPVTGSQPLVALKPSVPQPGLVPLVMSLYALANEGE
jgi:hypothetical protein